jgi:hypothetical protein
MVPFAVAFGSLNERGLSVIQAVRQIYATTAMKILLENVNASHFGLARGHLPVLSSLLMFQNQANFLVSPWKWSIHKRKWSIHKS